MQSYSRISQIFRNIHCALEKGVLFDSFILIHRPESLIRDNFIVSGITSSIFNDIKLWKIFFKIVTSVRNNKDIATSLTSPRKHKIQIHWLKHKSELILMLQFYTNEPWRISVPIWYFSEVRAPYQHNFSPPQKHLQLIFLMFIPLQISTLV